MPYRIKRKESVLAAVQRIACEQIDTALDEVESHDLDRHETIHQLRKRCKKIRGLIRLVRPAFESTYQRENAWYRDAAQELSYVRDAQAILETHDELLAPAAKDIARKTLKSVRQNLCNRRQEIVSDEAGIDARLQTFAEKLREGRRRVEAWKLEHNDFSAIKAGLKTTYRRACKAMCEAYEEPTVENFHQWRKRVKYHWYHLRLLRDVWKPVIKVRRNAASDLADLLGDDHDLAVLKSTVLDEKQRFCNAEDDADDVLAAYLAQADRSRTRLQQQALPLGERLFAEKPKHFCRRMQQYWTTWRG